jgi:hypothetical protein
MHRAQRPSRASRLRSIHTANALLGINTSAGPLTVQRRAPDFYAITYAEALGPLEENWAENVGSCDRKWPKVSHLSDWSSTRMQQLLARLFYVAGEDGEGEEDQTRLPLIEKLSHESLHKQ